MTFGRRTSSDERGMAALALLCVAVVSALALFVFVAVPLTEAGDAKAESHSAADAAALAGADWMRVSLRDQFSSQGWPGSWGGFPAGDGGLSAARQYAERNDAVLVTYSPPSVLNNWTAYARVRGRGVDGKTNESEARARFDLPECTQQTTPTTEPPEPTPSDDDQDDDEDEEPPPPPPPDSYSCGGIEFELPTDGGPRTISESVVDAIFADAEPRLIS